MSRPTLLLDGFNLLIRNFCVLPTMNEDGEHNGGLYGSLNSIRSYAYKFNPEKIVMCWDGPGGSKKRQKMYGNYKSQRKVPSRMCRAYDFLTPDEERKSMFHQLDRFREYLNQIPVHQLKVDMTEADDLIAHCCHHLDSDNIIIISTDKDFMQLVSDRVRMFTPTKKEMIGPEEVFERFGIHPKNFVLIRALVGDNSDNIKGYKGIGVKTARKLFPIVNKDKKLYPVDVVDFAKKQLGARAKGAKKYGQIVENSDTLNTNYSIMQLREPLISLPSVTEINAQLQLPVRANMPRLRLMFTEDKMGSQIKVFDRWVRIFLPLATKGRH